jgi:hypothetical protein
MLLHTSIREHFMQEKPTPRNTEGEPEEVKKNQACCHWNWFHPPSANTSIISVFTINSLSLSSFCVAGRGFVYISQLENGFGWSQCRRHQKRVPFLHILVRNNLSREILDPFTVKIITFCSSSSLRMLI